MRPIDQLIAILKSVVKCTTPKLDDFEDFCSKYPVEEVLNMLVQIVAEGNEAHYLISEKVD